MSEPGRRLMVAGAVWLVCLVAVVVCGCATIIEGPTQTIRAHCQPADGVDVAVDGKAKTIAGEELFLEKTRETHFVTFAKAGFGSSTVAFHREINPWWPIANVIWGPAYPVALFVDWQTGSLFRIDPRDLHVVLRQEN